MRPSSQIRAVWPEGELVPHPRAVRLARTHLTIAAAGNGVGFSDLTAAGFTTAELIEHAPEAERILQGWV